MTVPAWTRDLFSAIDAGDADAFASHLAEDAVFQFGNAEPIAGREAVRETVAAFLASIQGLEHTLQDAWTPAGAVIVRGLVTYTRHDGSTLTVPFANVFEMDGDAIARYLIYVDISRLFA